MLLNLYSWRRKTPPYTTVIRKNNQEHNHNARDARNVIITHTGEELAVESMIAAANGNVTANTLYEQITDLVGSNEEIAMRAHALPSPDELRRVIMRWRSAHREGKSLTEVLERMKMPDGKLFVLILCSQNSMQEGSSSRMHILDQTESTMPCFSPIFKHPFLAPHLSFSLTARFHGYHLRLNNY